MTKQINGQKTDLANLPHNLTEAQSKARLDSPASSAKNQTTKDETPFCGEGQKVKSKVRLSSPANNFSSKKIFDLIADAELGPNAPWVRYDADKKMIHVMNHLSMTADLPLSSGCYYARQIKAALSAGVATQPETTKPDSMAAINGAVGVIVKALSKTDKPLPMVENVGSPTIAQLAELLPFTSGDEVRYYLGGVAVLDIGGQTALAATDGCVAGFTFTGDYLKPLQGYIIPAHIIRALAILDQVIETAGLRIYGLLEGKQMVFEVKTVLGHTVWLSGGIDGTFPDVERILLGKNAKTRGIIKPGALAALKAEKAKLRVLALANDKPTKSLGSIAALEALTDCKADSGVCIRTEPKPGKVIYTGRDILGVNVDYAMKIAKFMGEGVPCRTVQDGGGPIQFGDGNKVALLMLMRIGTREVSGGLDVAEEPKTEAPTPEKPESQDREKPTTAPSFTPYHSPGGTHLQGYCADKVTFADLVRVFGAPNSDGDGYKVDAEWCLRFADGTIATIYNYKTGKNYCGEEGAAVEDLSGADWHIGGENKKAVDHVNAALGYSSEGCHDA